jgi:hypothetical protein
MNSNRQARMTPTVTLVIMVAAIIAGIAALTWGNFQFASQNPGGNDFLVHWMGTRALLKEGISPYSDEAALMIQTMAYGRPARPGEHELRVAYPLYSVVLFAPFALINDFALARAFWMTLLEVCLIALVIFSLRLVNWKPSPIFLAGLFIFSLLWYHGLRPLINGNAVVVVAVGLVGALLALRDGSDELAGVLFAFTTIKPQVVVLVLAFVCVWGFVNRRWRLLSWLVGTVALLTAAAALMYPDWIMQNLREVMRYPGYNPPGTPGTAFASWWPVFGARIGWAMTILITVLLLFEWRAVLKAGPRAMIWGFFLTLTAGQWSGIQTDPGNFIVLFPVLILVLGFFAERSQKGAEGVGAVLLVVLLGGLWWLFLGTVAYGDQPVQSPIMFFPLPGLMLLLLYWVRWWAVRPMRTWIEQIDL